MRDLDKRGLMVSDFLLVSGDVVSNVSLESALVKHRARREKDKNAIMTMVLKEAGPEHRTKSTGRRPVFVIDPDADRCVHYEELGHQKKNDRYVRLEPDMLKAHSQLEIREDLIDCYIDICTPEVLSLWSDNFDYQSIRQSFLSEVLKDYELTRKTIHTYVVVDQYAARVQSLRAYNAVTKDVVSRWTYPLCPDSNLVKGQSYHLGRGKIYQEEGVILARTCVVRSRSVLGENTSLADESIVGDSVLGRRCRIGKNVIIDRSYLWDDVVVGEGSSVRQAIIANDVKIGKNCKIEPGALISFGVRIADDTIVAGTSKVTRAERREHVDSAPDNTIVGKGGDGYLFCEDNDSDTTSTTSNLLYQLPRASTSGSSISTLNSEEDEYEKSPTISRRSSFVSDHSEETTKSRDFHFEAVASILDGLQKGDLPETILLELNSYRMSVDANPHEVRHAVVAALIKRISSLVGGDSVSGTTAQSPQEAIAELFRKYKALVGRNIFDKDEDSKVDQVDFLLLVQKEVMGKSQGESIMLFVAKQCYDLDIIEEDGVLQWWEDDRSQREDLKRVKALTEPFIVFLREAEEEESDESSEED